ncbi:capping protein inhibiting regulator of actin dynamics isoform X1 [Sebastes umbrosus]|uniref:capping protein inhibiting regulator of actin dynamics isoform X1 n=1 Tax=Sebastes umbrosus TaxID=72105 RepID=UPI00189D9B30|nr:capping protein inhibiting regulator of actin dynamics isoform X1 [Sebastes umbrosus]
MSSWLQSLRDEFTLRPFEIEHTHSESAAMASAPPDVMVNQEPAEVVEECSGKKKSKFQTFKKFFARKKRKEPPAAGADAGLKASQSSDNVSKTSENNTLTRSEKEKGSGSKISLGNKALSHDSVFVSESSEANEALGASQDSIHGKVKSLQLQLRQAIRLGSPPSIMCVKRTDDGGTMSEDDGLPCSPPELTTPHTVMNQAQRNSSISLEGIDTDDDQQSCPASSRAVSPLVVPGDFSQPASPFGCLDNSAAKHKLGLRHKARRKPVSRLDLKAEGDSVLEDTLNTSIAETSEEREQQKTTEGLSGDELKLKVDKEEEDNEEEEQPQRSRHSLLRDEEERAEGEDESKVEQDVSDGPDSSSPPEEEAPDAQPLPSSKPSSRASSLDSARVTPESPVGPREYSLDPPGIAYGAEEKEFESDLELSGEEDGVQESREEESSFLQEVLSSLKTPMASCSLVMETEGAVLQIEEDVNEKQIEDAKIEEGEEVKEEEAEANEPVGYQAAPAGSLLSDQTTEEEEEEEEEVATLSTTSRQDVEEEEKVEDKEEEGAAEVEELVVEQQQEEGEKEEAEEVTPEEQNNMLTGNAVNQAEEEEREEKEEESEGEEEAIELVKEPEVEEVGREKREEEEVEVEVKEAKERVEEAEEAIEEERDNAEEVMEMFPDAAGEDVAMPLQEEDEGVDVVVGDDAVCVPQHTNDEEIPSELGDATVQDSQASSYQSFGEEREDGDEEVEKDLEVDHTEQKSDQEEDGEVNQPEEDQSEEDVQQEDVETSRSDMKQEEIDPSEATEQASVSSKPPPLSLPESNYETQPQESGTITPSRTTTIHINLLSPSSEKAPSFFQQSPTEAHPKESETPCGAVEQNTAATEEEEEPADNVEAIEEERQLVPEGEATPPAAVEEEVNQPSGGSDQSKACFTIAPAWQRSLSVGDAEEEISPPPSSPPTCISSSLSTVTGRGSVEVEAKTNPDVKAEPTSPAKVELALSPGRVRNAGTTTVPSPSSTQPQTSSAASTEGSSIVVEGNPDNPFGVRLRKTSVLHRFSSEEESTESPMEPPAQPTSCRVDSPQPISVKPSISPPVSNKPALPKKPDVRGDSGGKNKRMSDPATGVGVSGGSGSPSWISMAKHKQKIYKENSLDEITVRKEEPERKNSLPMYVSSAASKEHSNRTVESTGKVSPLELSKPVEKEARRSLSPPTPVPPQPPKSQSLPCPVPPKPQLPPTAKHPPQPTSPHISLSPTTPIPVHLKSPSCTSPMSPSKPATSPKTPQSTTLTSPPFSSRTAPEKSRSPGLSSQTPASQRGLPAPASPQDEPPWMALAKKKAKAWSEMPQIVQ